jgi:hypothetical protein
MRKRIAINNEQRSIRVIGYGSRTQDRLVGQLWPKRGRRHSYLSEDIRPTKGTNKKAIDRLLATKKIREETASAMQGLRAAE